MRKEYYYGSHVGVSNHGIIGAIDEIIKYNGNFIQIFITNPKARITTKRSDEELQTINHYAKYNKVKIVIHSPYLLNFAHSFRKKSWGVISLIDHLNTCAKLDAVGVVVHSGKYLDMDKSDAIENMYINFNYVLKRTPARKSNRHVRSCGAEFSTVTRTGAKPKRGGCAGVSATLIFASEPDASVTPRTVSARAAATRPRTTPTRIRHRARTFM